MRASLRIGFAAAAASLALAHSPLAAQVAVTPGQTSENSIGPSQLENFSLDGTVIRRAEPAAQRNEPAPTRQRQTATASPQQAEPAPAGAESQRQTAEQGEREVSRPTQTAAAPSTRPQPNEPGRSSFTDALFTPAPALPSSMSGPSESASFAPAETFPDPDSGFSPLPWLLAILLLGGAAAWYFRRQRSGVAFAGGPQVSEFAAPEPAPQRAPVPVPAPAPSPPPPALPVGIVSTRLRPWLDVQFRPTEVRIEADRAIVEFEILVENSGSGPAREILVEAAMFNAGPDQDAQIGAFFERPVGQGERAPMLAPLKSMAFKSAVQLPRERLLQFKAGDRIVFVPLIGLNVLYRWTGGDAQTSASYLVGKSTTGEKLAPFRADQGPRTFGGVAARLLDPRIRK